MSDQDYSRPKFRTRPLSARQQLFVLEYLACWNGTQAAIRAGYSAKTAHITAGELIRHPAIATSIAAAQAKRAKRLEISADRVIAKIAKIAFGDIRQLFNEDGTPKRPDELDADAAALVRDVEVSYVVTRDGRLTNYKLKLHDKLAALVTLGKHLGLFAENVNVNVRRDPREISDQELVRLIGARSAGN